MLVVVTRFFMLFEILPGAVWLKQILSTPSKIDVVQSEDQISTGLKRR
jgi:hypothetical protein